MTYQPSEVVLFDSWMQNCPALRSYSQMQSQVSVKNPVVPTTKHISESMKTAFVTEPSVGILLLQVGTAYNLDYVRNLFDAEL